MKRRMSALDAVFIQAERSEAPQHGSILFVLRRPPGAKADYLAGIAASMREYPVTAERFNYVLTPGPTRRLHPTWTVLLPEQIDLDYHFRHSALPQPGGERELATLVSRLVTHPINLDRPPWEIHLIEGLENDRFAILLKLHHAMADGTTAVRMMMSWLSPDPDDRQQPPLWAHDMPRAKRSTTSSPPRLLAAAEAIVGAAKVPFAAAGDVARALSEDVIAATFSTQSLVAPYQAPRTILNGRVTQRRRVATQRLPIDRVRTVADQTGGTINDAIAVILGTAMRRYLQELEALPGRSLVAGVVTSLRPTMTDHAADQAGNVISMMFADLATDVDDVTSRATRLIASTRAGKEHLLGLKQHAMAYSGLMLAPFLAGALTGTGHLFPPLQNVGLSNVPGTRTPMFHNGAEVEAVHATTIVASGGALVVTVTSWGDQFCFTVTGCPDAAPHCQRVAVYLSDALDEVEAALAN